MTSTIGLPQVGERWRVVSNRSEGPRYVCGFQGEELPLGVLVTIETATPLMFCPDCGRDEGRLFGYAGTDYICADHGHRTAIAYTRLEPVA